MNIHMVCGSNENTVQLSSLKALQKQKHFKAPVKISFQFNSFNDSAKINFLTQKTKEKCNFVVILRFYFLIVTVLLLRILTLSLSAFHVLATLFICFNKFYVHLAAAFVAIGG